MRNIALVLAAAGAIGLAATATPANAGFVAGLKAPSVESNTIDARCWHRRWSSRWVCQRGWHRRWRSRHWW
ncbi:MAG: hypothetical protein KF835_08805 [Xanthobacteraceae bacterium]|nr:hypothetical protein [Xanthobacteraceae bacterium]